MLNTLTPIQCNPFWYFVAFTEGWCKFAYYLMLISCISEFAWNWFLFLTMNNRRERIYWEGRGKISKLVLIHGLILDRQEHATEPCWLHFGVPAACRTVILRFHGVSYMYKIIICVLGFREEIVAGG